MMSDAIEQMAQEAAQTAEKPAASMSSPEEAKEIIRRWNEEGWSGGKYDLAHEIISPNMIVHGAGGQTVGMGPDGLIDLIKTWRTAFPDGRMEIDDLIVEGDTVAIRNTWHGTQKPSSTASRRAASRSRSRRSGSTACRTGSSPRAGASSTWSG